MRKGQNGKCYVRNSGVLLDYPTILVIPLIITLITLIPNPYPNLNLNPNPNPKYNPNPNPNKNDRIF